ncbi:24224_t:CDS:2, partial [Racocetra persica]
QPSFLYQCNSNLIQNANFCHNYGIAIKAESPSIANIRRHNNEDQIIKDLIEKEKSKDFNQRFKNQLETHNVIRSNIIRKNKNNQIKDQKDLIVKPIRFSSRSGKGVIDSNAKAIKTKFDVSESLDI